MVPRDPVIQQHWFFFETFYSSAWFLRFFCHLCFSILPARYIYNCHVPVVHQAGTGHWSYEKESHLIKVNSICSSHLLPGHCLFVAAWGQLEKDASGLTREMACYFYDPLQSYVSISYSLIQIDNLLSFGLVSFNSHMHSCESDSLFLNRLFYWWMLKNGFDYCSLLLGRHACLWMDLLNFMVSFLSNAHRLCSPLEWLYRPLLNFNRKAWALLKYRYSQPLLPHKISSRCHQPWRIWGAPWEVKFLCTMGVV